MYRSQNSRHLFGYHSSWSWSSLSVDSGSSDGEPHRTTVKASPGAVVSSEAGLGEGLLLNSVVVVTFRSMNVSQ